MHTHIMKIFAFFLAVFAASANGQIVVNGGFEANTSYSTFNPGSSFTGWSVTSDSTAIVGLPLSTFGTPYEGSQVLIPAFTSSSAFSTVQQLISGFVPGRVYSLNFYTSAYSTPTYSGISSAIVTLGSESLSFSYDIPPEFRTFGAPSSPWIQRSVNYMATSSSAYLTVTVNHGTTDPYIGFDSFSIVPEPSVISILAFCICTYGAITFVRRRKEKC